MFVLLFWRISPVSAQEAAPQAVPQAATEPSEPSGGSESVGSEPSGAVEAKEPGSAAETVQPPQLLTFVEAEYPAAALEARQEGSVVLRLSIDAEGRVTEAEVKEPLGLGLDEAAQAAALRFLFSPAQRGEMPVAARILYSYEFRLPAPAPATPEPVAPPVDPTALAAAAPGRPSVPSATAAPAAPAEVVVHGVSDADRKRQSAEAVTVIDLEQAQRQSADMGELLARSQGIGVQRGGGLGSTTRFSLNGLTDDQVRFFLDGLPLELVGYPCRPCGSLQRRSARAFRR
jgi:vitamin B12 transporter